MIDKNVKILSLAFLFTFFGYNGVQQFVTPFFSDLGSPKAGFVILILVYSSFTLSNVFIAGVVQRLGARKSMIIGSVFYSFFIFSLLAKQIFLIYIFAIFLGIAASFLWIGSTSYLVKSSNHKNYGSSSGFFHSSQSLGSTVGILLFGALLNFFSFKFAILLFAFLPLLGFMISFRLKEIPGVPVVNQPRLIKKTFTNISALKLSLIWFSFTFVYGFSQGILPLEIKKIFGPAFVTLLVIFQAFPILFSYIIGKISDIKGRNFIISFSFLLTIFSFVFMYLFPHNSIILVSGIIFLALVYAAILTMRPALVGDISDGKDVEFLTSLFFVMSNLGMLVSLFVPLIIFQAKFVYLTSIFIMVISYLVVFSSLKKPVEAVREEINKFYAR